MSKNAWMQISVIVEGRKENLRMLLISDQDWIRQKFKKSTEQTEVAGQRQTQTLRFRKKTLLTQILDQEDNKNIFQSRLKNWKMIFTEMRLAACIIKIYGRKPFRQIRAFFVFGKLI